jgi:uncharacterized protein YndB with AHSA1/START domain
MMADYSTSIDIDAPPDVVFEHLVTVEGMLSWMGQHAELQPSPGGSFAVDINGVPVRGAYLEIDPPRRVVVSWGVAGSDEHPPGSSRVEFTLTAAGDGTWLRLVHSGLPEPQAPRYATGWGHFLARLQVAAAGSDPGPDPWETASPAASPQELYDELAAEHLRRPEVTMGRALQNDVLKVNGKIFAFINGGRLVVKLPAPQAAALVAAGQAVPFQSGGRTMKEWVAVGRPSPPEDRGSWRRLMADASDYVAALARPRG